MKTIKQQQTNLKQAPELVVESNPETRWNNQGKIGLADMNNESYTKKHQFFADSWKLLDYHRKVPPPFESVAVTINIPQPS